MPMSMPDIAEGEAGPMHREIMAARAIRPDGRCPQRHGDGRSRDRP
jgi:hypothetical protein